MSTRVKRPSLLQHAAISALCLLIGYAAIYGILMSGVFKSTLLEDPFVKGVVGDILIQLLCGIPALLPAAFVIAALVLLVQSRRKLSERTTWRLNAIVSLILGMVVFVPYQFFFLMGAAL